MAEDPQLEWEARAARPAALAAFGGAILILLGSILQLTALRDAPGRNDPDRHKRTLVNFKEHASTLLASSIVQAVAALFAAGALYYLYRATRHRRPQLPNLVVGLLGLAPVLLLAAAFLSYSALKDAADEFARSPLPSAAGSTRPPPPTSAQLRKAARDCRGASARSVCVRRKAREAQEDARADKLIKDTSPLGPALGEAGTLALAGALVLLSLNAMRVGLLTRFMGVLGAVAGGLLVLPFLLPAPIPVVELFWLAAVGVIFLGRYRGGRGPAWEVPEAVPWPSAAERARQSEAASEDAEPAAAEETSDGRQAAARRSSRKRKKKRR